MWLPIAKPSAAMCRHVQVLELTALPYGKKVAGTPRALRMSAITRQLDGLYPSSIVRAMYGRARLPL